MPTRRWLQAAIVAVVIVGLGWFLLNYQTEDKTSEKLENPKTTSGVESFKKGDFKEAISDLEEAVKQDPDDAKAQQTLGRSYEATGKLDKAVKAYEASLKAKPKQPEVLYNLGIIYKSRGKLKEATAQLEKAVEQNEDFMGARIILGDIYARQGKKNKAKEQYQAVIDKKPFGVDLKKIQDKLNEVK